MATKRSPWQALDKDTRWSLASAWRSGFPPEAAALYGRWWQLETWLRELIYVEQSALSGRAWIHSLPSSAAKRERSDAAQGYMATPDAQARLAYLDVSPLFGLLTDDWDRYADSLIDRPVWEGRVIELRKIRHRIGHCRRPHSDDLTRLEQTLRDLDAGAFRAVSAYNRQQVPSKTRTDPLDEAWSGGHPDARRLLKHAESNYGVFFSLRYSKRPWAQDLPAAAAISGEAGYLWHARFIVTDGRPVDLRRLWSDDYLDPVREQMVFLTINDPYGLEVSFAAIDDPSTTADAIGRLFDAVLTSPASSRVANQAFTDRWARDHSDLDARVQVQTAWSIVDDTTTPITMFGA